MTETSAEEEVPVHEGPDPKDWPDAAPHMWGAMLNIEFLDRIIEALDGRIPEGTETVHGEVRAFLNFAREQQRADLARMVARAYHLRVPDEEASPATEAVGGSGGDSTGEGNGDHLRRVQG